MNKIFQKKFPYGVFEIFDDKPKMAGIVEVEQTHSDILLLEKDYNMSITEADGMIFTYQTLAERSHALVIKTADCLPILYMGEEEVALVHAGWRGLFQKIHLSEKLQNINPQMIYIGPCIHFKAFEVQADFKEHFPTSEHFHNINDKLHFDLVGEALSQLKATFPKAQISASDICTFENNQYNSYRRDKTEKRNWNIFKTN